MGVWTTGYTAYGTQTHTHTHTHTHQHYNCTSCIGYLCGSTYLCFYLSSRTCTPIEGPRGPTPPFPPPPSVAATARSG